MSSEQAEWSQLRALVTIELPSGAKTRVQTWLNNETKGTLAFRWESVDASGAMSPQDLSFIDIETKPFTMNGIPQPDQLEVHLQFRNFNRDLGAVKVELDAFDLSHDDSGRFLRPTSNPDLEDRKNAGILTFQLEASGRLVAAQAPYLGGWKTTLAAVNSSSSVPTDFDLNFEAKLPSQWSVPGDSLKRGEILNKCSDAASWASYKGSFVDQSLSSWNFNPPTSNTVVFDGPGTRAAFNIFAIANRCEVRAGAQVVAGFLVCRELEIFARS